MKYSLLLTVVVALVAAAPAEDSPRAVCPCEPVFCIQSWPESCYCQNNAARVCYETCGGPEPIYGDCGEDVPIVSPLEPYQRCGSRGLEPCADGTVCVDDPASEGCGQACDMPGYCVPDVFCGGFRGQACASEEQVCADDPRDDCDPKDGGADCGGLCFTPPALS